MPRFAFDKDESRKENLLVKRRLRRYYKWRYGQLPPSSWQADHQVEQHGLVYARFGGKYVHNIANLIYVPPEINAMKNTWYGKPWEKALKKYHYLQPVRLPPGASSRDLGASETPFETLRIRDGLYRITQFMNEAEAFVFLTRFSRDCLLRMIWVHQNRIWKKTPPEWLVKNPKWLRYLLDDVRNHQRYVREFELAFPGQDGSTELESVSLLQPPPTVGERSQEELRQIFLSRREGGQLPAESEDSEQARLRRLWHARLDSIPPASGNYAGEGAFSPILARS